MMTQLSQGPIQTAPLQFSRDLAKVIDGNEITSPKIAATQTPGSVPEPILRESLQTLVNRKSVPFLPEPPRSTWKSKLGDAAASAIHLGMKVAAKIFYRIRTTGSENIPLTGAAVLVCNHQSIIDFLITSAISPRPVNFVMYYKYFNLPVLKTFAQMAGAIPIAGQKEDPAVFKAAFARISKDLQAGRLVVIFPEGKITEDGQISEFKKGIEHIIAADRVPTVPMAMKGMWDSSFSRKDGHPVVESLKFWTHRFRPRIEIRAETPVAPENVKAAALETKVREIWNGIDLPE